jgi:hypothetical protein
MMSSDRRLRPRAICLLRLSRRQTSVEPPRDAFHRLSRERAALPEPLLQGAGVHDPDGAELEREVEQAPLRLNKAEHSLATHSAGLLFVRVSHDSEDRPVAWASVHQCSPGLRLARREGHPTPPSVASKERASKHIERERREEHDSRDRPPDRALQGSTASTAGASHRRLRSRGPALSGSRSRSRAEAVVQASQLRKVRAVGSRTFRRP